MTAMTAEKLRAAAAWIGGNAGKYDAEGIAHALALETWADAYELQRRRLRDLVADLRTAARSSVLMHEFGSDAVGSLTLWADLLASLLASGIVEAEDSPPVEVEADPAWADVLRGGRRKSVRRSE